MLEKILTLSAKNETKMKEKGSVFLCISLPVSSIDECNSHLEKIRKEYYKATHICFAYQLGENNFRYSDAGEPSGTAGIRIFNAIEHFGLSYVLVIVVRWFGGVKLGVGPLGKAYYSSAYENLNSSIKFERYAYKSMQINCSFRDISNVHHILSKIDVKNIQTFFSNKVELSFSIRINDIEKVKEGIKSLSDPATKIVELNEITFL